MPGRVLDGDVMAKWPLGGMFVTKDVPAEQARFDARETVTAGPMFGKKTFPAEDIAAERESAVLRANGLSIGSFGGNRSQDALGHRTFQLFNSLAGRARDLEVIEAAFLGQIAQ